MLAGVRILDLTDRKGFLCGRILADLGAEVIKIEPPGGDPARQAEPRCGTSGPGLYWLGYNANKKGVVLDICMAEGQRIFRELAARSHAVIESFEPGAMARLGLGYDALNEANASLVLTSISFFGQTGPYAGLKGNDLVCTAMSGYMYLTGDTDRAPLKIGYPLAYVQAGCNAAAATMIAYHHSVNTGRGQWVDVSIQEATVQQMVNAVPYWQLERTVLRRAGQRRSGVGSGLNPRQTWRCKDGFVSFTLRAGKSHIRPNRSLVEWMQADGVADDFMLNFDWATWDIARTTQEVIERAEDKIAEFFLRHTKDELYEQGIMRHVDVYPVATPADLVGNVQLESRGFWRGLEQPESGEKLLYPGAFVKSSELDLGPRHPAPAVGQHNADIYDGLLGLSTSEIERLHRGGVI